MLKPLARKRKKEKGRERLYRDSYDERKKGKGRPERIEKLSDSSEKREKKARISLTIDIIQF